MGRKIYHISNSNGLTGPDWRSEYNTVEDAAEAIRFAYGWDEVVVSSPFTDDDEDGNATSAWSAYESQERCDADDTGDDAPRIIERNGGKS